MKAIKLLLLALVLVGPVWATKPADTVTGPETTVNAAALYVDSVFGNALAMLELVAATPEARGGDWNGIKRYLQQAEASLPGVYFYVLPNGNYYSVALDYTNLNLGNRGYFKSLFEGNAIKGFPVYSRSSGKKSAVVAVPIVVGGKVSGALGVSVFLDELHAKLNRDLALPPGHTWFVVDAAGNTMLDGDADFIFMNTLASGSPSLREAIGTALKHESGAMRYEFNGARQAHYRKLPNMGWWMVLARIEGETVQPPPQLTLSLERFVAELQGSLDRIDTSLAKQIEKVRPNITQEGEIRKLLSAFINENLDVVDVSFVDGQGVLRLIEPSEYKNFENADVSKREHVAALLKSRKPIFSSAFRAFEGFLAVELSHPLHDARRSFLGSINAFIRPELLIEPLLSKSHIPDDYELWIMQPDGMIVFDQDSEEIGRMLFSDPLYAGYGSLLEMGRKIAASPDGKGSYIFLAPASREKVIKEMVWQTVRLHGREWRVILAYRPYE